jgi:hypothetical protein
MEVCAGTLKHSHLTLSLLTLLIMASLRYSPYSRYCHQCRTCVLSFASKSFLCTRCEERNRIPWADRTHDRCPTCKRICLVADFPLNRNNYRTASCAVCLARLRDSYRERKGESVSKEGQARRLTHVKRVVERALQTRIQLERRKELWLEARKQ